MRRLLLLPIVASFALVACTTNLPDPGNNSSVPVENPTPVRIACPGNTVSNSTTLDEKVALGVETTYAAARVAAEAAVDAGVVKGASATRLRKANRQAYDAVLALRAAYCAGNQDSYLAAAINASGAVSVLLAVTRGDK